MNGERYIQAVIFDMNGVIVDDEHIHEATFKKVLAPYGISLTHGEYLRYCAGKTDEAGFLSITEATGVDLPIAQLAAARVDIYCEIFPGDKKSFPGVHEAIEALAARYPLGLASSSRRRQVDLVLKELDLTRFFPVTISADDISKGKPDPEPYIKTAGLLGVDPTACAVIEDTVSGIKSAKAAGMYCIAVTTTHRREDLHEADAVADAFSEIMPERIAGLPHTPWQKN